MPDRPILFSAPMVRALLEGRKTQTRRIIKEPFGTAEFNGKEWKPIHTKIRKGDRLWVKESYIAGFDLDEDDRPTGNERAWFRADPKWPTWYDPDSESTLDSPPWKSSLFMPRKLSRLTLTVTDVRAERLQDISEADAIAEGVLQREGGWQGSEHGLIHRTAKQGYRALWSVINGPGSWDANPWVAAYTFIVHHGNIERVAA